MLAFVDQQMEQAHVKNAKTVEAQTQKSAHAQKRVPNLATRASTFIFKCS